jgi:hypothetical protein
MTPPISFPTAFTKINLQSENITEKLQEKTLELVKSLVQANLWHHTDAFSNCEKLGPKMIDAVGWTYHRHNDSFLLNQGVSTAM